MKLKTSVVSLLLSSLFAISAQAKEVHLGYLETAEQAFRVIPGQKYGLETEMVNLKMEQAVDIIIARLGGVATKNSWKEIAINGTAIGEVLVKLEVNETSTDPNIDWAKKFPNAAIEIVSEPILFETGAVNLYSKIISELYDAGAQGTIGADGKINPVSIQVNMGVDISNPDKVVAEVLAITRNYLSPNHQAQIKENLEIPRIRKPYLKPYSKGMMGKIFSGNYNPTAKEFYFDFFYRQSLEFELKDQSVWTMSEAEVRARIEALNYPVHVEVIKLNQIKVASMLLELFPDDPYTKAVLKQGWIKAAPLIEFRNRNNDFNVMRAVRESTGIVLMSKDLGVYDNDTVVAERMGIDKKEIWTVRKEQGAKRPNYHPTRPIMSCRRVIPVAP